MGGILSNAEYGWVPGCGNIEHFIRDKLGCKIFVFTKDEVLLGFGIRSI
jgi:hypothetical protein